MRFRERFRVRCGEIRGLVSLVVGVDDRGMWWLFVVVGVHDWRMWWLFVVRVRNIG